jgi:hypothetical protein
VVGVFTFLIQLAIYGLSESAGVAARSALDQALFNLCVAVILSICLRILLPPRPSGQVRNAEIGTVIGRFGRFVRSREWPPTSGVAVRSVFGLLFGVFGIVLGVVRLDPYALLVSLIALPAIALWPKQHGGPPK